MLSLRVARSSASSSSGVRSLSTLGRRAESSELLSRTVQQSSAPSTSRASSLQSRSISSQPCRTPLQANPPSTLLSQASRPSLVPSQLNNLKPKQQVAYFRASDEERPVFTPPKSDAETAQYLHDLFYPLQFPEELAVRACTHMNWAHGKEGHNARLAFLGRRVLHAYLAVFLQAAAQKTKTTIDIEAVSSKVLDTYEIGKFVGNAWRLQLVLRWISSKWDATDGSQLIGLAKVRGTCAEAIMGAVLHEHGGTVAHRVFHTRFLPHMKHYLPQSVRWYADEVCQQLGGQNGELIWKDDAGVVSDQSSSAPTQPPSSSQSTS